MYFCRGSFIQEIAFSDEWAGTPYRSPINGTQSADASGANFWKSSMPYPDIDVYEWLVSPRGALQKTSTHWLVSP